MSVLAGNSRPTTRQHSCLLYAVPYPVLGFEDEARAALRVATQLELPICVLAVITEAVVRGPELEQFVDPRALQPTPAERLATAWAEIDRLERALGFPDNTHYAVEVGQDFALTVATHANRHGCELIAAGARLLDARDAGAGAHDLIALSPTPLLVLTSAMLQAERNSSHGRRA